MLISVHFSQKRIFVSIYITHKTHTHILFTKTNSTNCIYKNYVYSFLLYCFYSLTKDYKKRPKYKKLLVRLSIVLVTKQVPRV